MLKYLIYIVGDIKNGRNTSDACSDHDENENEGDKWYFGDQNEDERDEWLMIDDDKLN